MKSDFTAVVSHELRTPLTSIRGSLGLILGALSQSLPAKVRELLEIAQSNCERLVLLVNDILDIEKFSAGQMRFDMQTVPLADVMRQAVEANEGYARKFQVRIALESTDAALQVSVDPDRFIQVMTNLLSNAAKYSPQGGTVRVRAATRRLRAHQRARFWAGNSGELPRAHFREILAGRFIDHPRKGRHRPGVVHRAAFCRAHAWPHWLRFGCRRRHDILGGTAAGGGINDIWLGIAMPSQCFPDAARGLRCGSAERFDLRGEGWDASLAPICGRRRSDGRRVAPAHGT